MRTIYSERQRLHSMSGEFNRGVLRTPYERPERADRIVDALTAAHLGSIESPSIFPVSHAARVHRPNYVEFLQTAYAKWVAAGRTGDALPTAWAIRGLRSDRIPTSIDGELSYYSFDSVTAITAGTWEAAKSSMDVALSGAQHLVARHETTVFSLCRPIGHHAASDYFGGYCYLNNAAIAAQYLHEHGATRVAVLDVDYHHGNGSQNIFYRRPDVLYVSIHADPATDYPYFLGYADELGEAAGKGFNRNLPLERGADWARWSDALEIACEVVRNYAADALVVSLGVDTFEKDPLSAFRLQSEDYLRMGERIGRLHMPTLIVMEGGYAIDEIGINVANALCGFLQSAG